MAHLQVIAALGLTLSGWQDGRVWPAITPVVTEVKFRNVQLGDDTPTRLTIDDVTGGPAYELECHNGDYNDTARFNYSGLFHCALFPVINGTGTAVNLLAEDTRDGRSSDYRNRGRFLAEQLHPPCSEFIDYNDTRRFSLRGLSLTLRLTNMVWDDQAKYPRLIDFDLLVSVVSDPSGSTPFAARPKAPRPPHTCYP